MDIQEIKLDDLVEEKFIETQVAELKKTVGDGVAVNALFGGGDDDRPSGAWREPENLLRRERNHA
jgi:hypothetical protein